MNNQRMWRYAIAMNVIAIIIIYSNYSAKDDIYRVGLLLFPLYLLIGNLAIGVGINMYYRHDDDNSEGRPFFYIGLLIALVGFGLCVYK